MRKHIRSTSVLVLELLFAWGFLTQVRGGVIFEKLAEFSGGLMRMAPLFKQQMVLFMGLL